MKGGNEATNTKINDMTTLDIKSIITNKIKVIQSEMTPTVTPKNRYNSNEHFQTKIYFLRRAAEDLGIEL